MNWYLDSSSPSGLSSKRLKRPIGCIGNHGYYQVTCRKLGTLLAHRVIWELLHGHIPDGMAIDHIDRNRANNAIDNLRLVTPAENSENTGVHVDSITGVKNIVKHQAGFAIEVMRSGKRIRRIAATMEEALKVKEAILYEFT